MRNVVSPTPGSCVVSSHHHSSSPSLVMVTNLSEMETLKHGHTSASNDCQRQLSHPQLTKNGTFDTEAADSSCTPSPRNSQRGPLHSQQPKHRSPYDEDNDDVMEDRCSFFLPVAFNACMGRSSSTTWGRFSLVPPPALDVERRPDLVAATPESSSSFDSQDSHSHSSHRDRHDSYRDHREENEGGHGGDQFKSPPKTGNLKGRADTAPTPGTASTWTGSGSEADADAPHSGSLDPEARACEVSPLRSPEVTSRPPRLPSEDAPGDGGPSDLYPAPKSRGSPPPMPLERHHAVLEVPLPAMGEREAISDLLEEGRDAELGGHYEVALASFVEALERLRGSDAGPGMEAEIASTLHRLGTVRWKMASYHEALTDLRASAESYRDLCRTSGFRGRYRREAAEVFHQTGVVHLSLGRHREASRNLRKSLRVLGGDVGSDPDAARTLVRLGNVADERGRHADALGCYERGLAVQRSALGDRDVSVAHTLDSLGLLHERCGHLGRAMGCYSEALFVYRVALGHEAADVGAALHNVGRVHHLWGELDEALGAFEEALRVTVNALGRGHRNVASILHGIGGVYLSQNRPEDAAGVWRDVLAAQRAALGDGHLDVAATLDSIAGAYEARGRFDKAARLRGKALRVRRSALGGEGRDHVYVALSLERAGECHERGGDFAAARERYREALEVCRASEEIGRDFRPLVERLTRKVEELGRAGRAAGQEDVAGAVTPGVSRGSASKRQSRRAKGVIVGGDFCY